MIMVDFPFPDAAAAVERAELEDARKLYRAEPIFRELAQEILQAKVSQAPGDADRNYAREALIDALHEWEHVEPEPPYSEYMYERTPEGHR